MLSTEQRVQESFHHSFTSEFAPFEPVSDRGFDVAILADDIRWKGIHLMRPVAAVFGLVIAVAALLRAPSPSGRSYGSLYDRLSCEQCQNYDWNYDCLYDTLLLLTFYIRSYILASQRSQRA